ncbi:unnamed protein product [Caenorhabditis bovis]|uniref:Uncharacterized protein n=1 Tax=Caenorhabditis bovis TaxID=2654633 RepID=A0A8S1F128_9PELO|nr:unnamed protein product [Caenorhabditis bovis]
MTPVNDSSIQVDAGGLATKSEYFFEGAEKLLELWFAATPSQLSEGRSLRNIPRDQLDMMLDVARCKILHSKHNESIDSYVLSWRKNPGTKRDRTVTLS